MTGWPTLPVWAQGSIGLVLVAVLLAAIVVFVPGIILGAGFVFTAWLKGWHPSRLRNVFFVLLGSSVLAAWWVGDWAAPVTTMRTAIEQTWDGMWLNGFVNATGGTLLLSSLGAWAYWQRYTRRMRSGAEGVRGERHVYRQLKRQEWHAQIRARFELTPISRRQRVILGHKYEDVYPHPELLGQSLGKRNAPYFDVPMERIKRHMACVGSSGSGKSTTLIKLSVGWTEAAWRTYRESSQEVTGSQSKDVYATRPLTIFVNCKGGRQGGVEASEWAEAMEALGLQLNRVGIFPLEDRLNMWRLPPRQLQASLHALAKTDHRFYDVLQRGLLHLLIDSPRGAPMDSLDLLKRINKTWLQEAWENHPVESEAVRALTAGAAGSGPSPLAADLMLFSELFRSLGGDFDAGRPLSDFDALYVMVPGSIDRVVAEAKAAVLIELLMYELSTQPRQTLFIVDEFSAITGKLTGSLTNLVERIRGMGGACIPSAQSYYGFGDTEDERQRLLTAMGGGMLIGRTEGAEPLAKRFGSRKVGEAGLQLAESEFTGTGSLRRQDAYLLDPNRVRQLPDRHWIYSTADKVTYGVVKPVDKTRRLPSPVITGSARRNLLVAGHEKEPVALLKAHRKTLEEQIPGWNK